MHPLAHTILNRRCSLQTDLYTTLWLFQRSADHGVCGLWVPHDVSEAVRDSLRNDCKKNVSTCLSASATGTYQRQSRLTDMHDAYTHVNRCSLLE